MRLTSSLHFCLFSVRFADLYSRAQALAAIILFSSGEREGSFTWIEIVVVSGSPLPSSQPSCCFRVRDADRAKFSKWLEWGLVGEAEAEEEEGDSGAVTIEAAEMCC